GVVPHDWNPKRVTIDIEREVTRLVPVKVVIASPPPVGFSVKPGSIQSVPKRIVVSGAESLVGPVSQALVSLSLNHATASVDRDLTPSLVDAAGHHVSKTLLISPGLVRVHAGISQLFSYKTLPVVANISGPPRS